MIGFDYEKRKSKAETSLKRKVISLFKIFITLKSNTVAKTVYLHDAILHRGRKKRLHYHERDGTPLPGEHGK